MAMIRYGSYNKPIFNDGDFAVTQATAVRNGNGSGVTVINDSDQKATAVKQIVHGVGHTHIETLN